jgi:hypothetical protein
MMKIEDKSTAHRTVLRTQVSVGRRRVRVVVSVPGRDIWAYQTAKIALQVRTLATRLTPEHSTSRAFAHRVMGT